MATSNKLFARPLVLAIASALSAVLIATVRQPEPALTTIPPAPAATPAQHAVEPPCIIITRHGKRVGGKALSLAYWPDGTFLFPDPAYRPGNPGSVNNSLIGKVDPAALAAVLDAADKAGFFTLTDRSYIVPDADHSEIRLHRGEHSATLAWHGSILPGFGGDLNTEPAYRDFIRVFRAANGAIQTLAPTEVARWTDIKEGATFRGYDSADPAQTLWLKAETR